MPKAKNHPAEQYALDVISNQAAQDFIQKCLRNSLDFYLHSENRDCLSIY